MPGVKFKDTGFAARLRSTRELRQMTQRELANRIGSSQARISILERGFQIRTTYLPEIAIALDVDAAWLVLGIGKRPLLATPEVRADPEKNVVRFPTAAEEASRIWKTVPRPEKPGKFRRDAWRDKLPSRKRA